MRTFVRVLVSSIAATRFLVSAVVIAICLIYSLLTMGNYTPLYTELAIRLQVSTMVLFILLYLVVTIVIMLMWYLWAGSSRTSIYSQRAWRVIYRQTDRTGLTIIDLGLILLVLGIYSLVVQTFVNNYLIEPATFFTILIVVSLLLGFLPTQRPRRVVVPIIGQSLWAVAQTIATEEVPISQVITALAIYNELDQQLPGYIDPNDPLPDGMVLEVPPHW